MTDVDHFTQLLTGVNLEPIEVPDDEIIIDGVFIFRTIDKAGHVHVYGTHTEKLHWSIRLGLLKGAEEILLNDLRHISDTP